MMDMNTNANPNRPHHLNRISAPGCGGTNHGLRRAVSVGNALHATWLDATSDTEDDEVYFASAAEHPPPAPAPAPAIISGGRAGRETGGAEEGINRHHNRHDVDDDDDDVSEEAELYTYTLDVAPPVTTSSSPSSAPHPPSTSSSGSCVRLGYLEPSSASLHSPASRLPHHLSPEQTQVLHMLLGPPSTPTPSSPAAPDWDEALESLYGTEGVVSACKRLQVPNAAALRRLVTASVVAELAYKTGRDDKGNAEEWARVFAESLPPGFLDCYSVTPSPPSCPQRYVVVEGRDAIYVGIMGTKVLDDFLVDARLSMEPVVPPSMLSSTLMPYLPAAVRSAFAGDDHHTTEEHPETTSYSASSSWSSRWSPTSLTKSLRRLLPMAHGGFLARSRSVPGEMLLARANESKKDLVLTGHSLGGAVATLVTLRLLAQAPSWLSVSEHSVQNRIHCVGFATPPVGNDALAALLAATGWSDRITNYLLPEDPIPHLLQHTPFRSKKAERKGKGSGTSIPEKGPSVPSFSPSVSSSSSPIPPTPTPTSTPTPSMRVSTSAALSALRPLPPSPAEPTLLDRERLFVEELVADATDRPTPTKEKEEEKNPSLRRRRPFSFPMSPKREEKPTPTTTPSTTIRGGLWAAMRLVSTFVTLPLTLLSTVIPGFPLGVLRTKGYAGTRSLRNLPLARAKRFRPKKSPPSGKGILQRWTRTTHRLAQWRMALEAVSRSFVTWFQDVGPKYASCQDHDTTRVLASTGVRYASPLAHSARAAVLGRMARASMASLELDSSLGRDTAVADMEGTLHQPTLLDALRRRRLHHGCRFYRLRIQALLEQSLSGIEPLSSDTEEQLLAAYEREMIDMAATATTVDIIPAVGVGEEISILTSTTTAAAAGTKTIATTTGAQATMAARREMAATSPATSLITAPAASTSPTPNHLDMDRAHGPTPVGAFPRPTLPRGAVELKTLTGAPTGVGLAGRGRDGQGSSVGSLWRQGSDKTIGAGSIEDTRTTVVARDRGCVARTSSAGALAHVAHRDRGAFGEVGKRSSWLAPRPARLTATTSLQP